MVPTSAPSSRLAQLPADARPREKMLAQGAPALADAELLALILRTGTQGQDVLTLSAQLLQDHGGLRGLLHAAPDALLRVKGLGPAKYTQLAAVLELTRRALAQELAQTPVLQSPQAVQRYLQLHLQGQEREVVCALFLNQAQQLIACETLFTGTHNAAPIYPREVARRALALNAAGLILAHNHPSGQAQPSAADRAVTQQVRTALALIDVQLWDHCIIAGNALYSFAENGELA